jgi:hypothetical protein
MERSRQPHGDVINVWTKSNEKNSVGFMKSRFPANMRLTFICLFTILACLFISIQVRGMNQYTYDVDSLVYMSPQIVEGTLGGEHRTGNVIVSDFTISAVHKGSLTVGQTIQVTALEFYSVAEKGFGHWRKLKDGDRFFFFGDRARNTFLYDIPTNAEIYWPAPSGVWLVDGEKALDFYQYMNPGPYVATLEGAATNASVPSVDELRMRIRRGIQREKEWRTLLERNATTNDIPRLLEILRKEKAARNGREGPYGYISPNSIAEMACKHLVALHDVSSLTNALNIDDKLFGALGPGFDSPDGRRFLWSKIMDEKQSIDERVKWTGILRMAGEGTPEEHQLKRIAEYATQTNQNQRLQSALLDSLQHVQNWWRFTHGGNAPDASIQSGVDEATTILKSFYEKTDSEEARYKIDLIFEGFSGEKDGIISILRFRSYDTSARRLNYSYDIRVWNGTNLATQIVFQNATTKQRFTMPVALKYELRGQGSSFEIKDVVLPKDLPNGHYQVFYEFLHDGKVVYTSHYFEADL